jgi:hypothetical protein
MAKFNNTISRRTVLSGLVATPLATAPAAAVAGTSDNRKMAEAVTLFQRLPLREQDLVLQVMREMLQAATPSAREKVADAGRVKGVGGDQFIDSGGRYLQHCLHQAHGGKWDLTFDERNTFVIVAKRLGG